MVTEPLSLGADQDLRDWTFVRKDGSRLTVSVSVTAAHDDEGNTTSYLSVVRDVTDRRAAEQALVFALDKERETNQRMLELDRAKGEFVSAVSHELRTPLTSIVGYTELLSDDHSVNLTEMQHQLIERIERNGERLLHLVEDLLTLARVEDGSLALERKPTDLRDAVRSATDEVSHAAHKGRVSLRVHLPPEPVVLEGDAAYLERLVLNLVSNAVKFTPEGGSVDVDVTAGSEVARAAGQGHRDGHPAGGAGPAVPAVLPLDPRHRARHPGHRARPAHRPLDRRGTPRQRRLRVDSRGRYDVPDPAPDEGSGGRRTGT